MLTQASSDRLLPTTDAGLRATFSSVFQSISWLSPPYEQHIFVHDKISLCFLGLTDLSIYKYRKTQASWVSATDSYGEKSLPALQLHFAPQQWRHVQTTYKVLLLSHRNTHRLPDMTACINTTAVTETTSSFFAWTFGLHYANISTWWCRHVGACLNEPF